LQSQLPKIDTMGHNFMKKYLLNGVAISVLLIAALGFVYLSPAGLTQFAQTNPTPAPDRTADKIDRPTSDPYRGDMARFDRENRAERLQIGRVMRILKISKWKSVADIGAGGGWFTVIAAKRAGEEGKVYAVDINEESITYINNRKEKENLPNIETVLGEPDDPMLPKSSIDAVLILNTYHEISEPVILLKNLLPSLKKNALVGIIDRNGRGDDHGIDESEVISEAKRAGYKLKERHYFVTPARMDYFLVFEINKSAN